MDIARGIRRRGFRKWYERELLAGHAHLLLLLLCVLGLLGAMEALSSNRQAWPAMVLSIVVSAALGVWALRRYLHLLMRAEHIANQANCPRCDTYARWQAVAPPGTDRGGGLEVCCKACQQRWRIHWE